MSNDSVLALYCMQNNITLYEDVDRRYNNIFLAVHCPQDLVALVFEQYTDLLHNCTTGVPGKISDNRYIVSLFDLCSACEEWFFDEMLSLAISLEPELYCNARQKNDDGDREWQNFLDDFMDECGYNNYYQYFVDFVQEALDTLKLTYKDDGPEIVNDAQLNIWELCGFKYNVYKDKIQPIDSQIKNERLLI